MSDHPTSLNYDVFLGRSRELMSAIGEAITVWSRVEHGLVKIFTIITKMPPQMVAEIVKPLRAFSLFVSIVDGAVKSVHKKEDLTYWDSLIVWIRELSGDRNYLAHTPIVVHNLDDPNKDDWGQAVPRIGPPVIPSTFGETRFAPMDLSEVVELKDDFARAAQLLEFVADVLQNHALRNITDPVVIRRRPPRKQRITKAPASPTTPPE